MYNLTISSKKSPRPWYLRYLKDFPGAFTKEEFVSKYGLSEKQWKNLCVANIEKWYDPKERDLFAPFRGEMYYPDHGVNLITGFEDRESTNSVDEQRAYRRALYRKRKLC
jgi:hypothetical protein